LGVKFSLFRWQKIDKIKSQLTGLADLMKPLSDGRDEGLEEDELETLRDAGIILRPRKGKGKSGPKHIVFVESNDEGACLVISLW
jgi:U3 small nucleolar RNA-associated protein 11